MSNTKIKPEKIKTPIQLLAVWLIGLVLLVSAFLTASTFVHEPCWLSPVYGITAVALIPIFITLIFILQTRFRPELLDDESYLTHKRLFETFRPENALYPPSPTDNNVPESGTLEEDRINTYESNEGIFLVHEWRPSAIPGQKADIVIFVLEHPQQCVSRSRIKSVEYELGRKFFDSPVLKTNSDENFRLDVSAYAGMLCVARVTLCNEKTLILKRYINFDE